MSVTTWTFSFLSIKPKLWVENGELYGRSSLLSQLFSLFSYSRHLHVNPKYRIIEIKTRKLWGLEDSKVINFDEVSHIEYDFSSIGTSWGFDGSSLWGRQDQMESYTVSLALKNQTEIPLFSFRGEGSTETGWTGVIFGGDSIIDFQGDQGNKSREFAEILSRMVGVSVGAPMQHISDKQGNRYFCKKCNRPAGPSAKKCIYCGGEIHIPDKPEIQVKEKVKKARCTKCNHLMNVKQRKCLYCQGDVEIVEI